MDSSGSDSARQQAAEQLGSNQSKYSSSMTTSSQQGSTKPAPYPFNLTRFYNMNDAPWVPLNSQSFSHLSPNASYSSAGPSFQQYRSKPVPSECDTANDDSGYGSTRPPYSINENNSVYDDESNPEAQTATQLLNSFNMDMDPVSNSQASGWAQPQPPSVSSSSDRKFCCPNCKQWLRTKSEMNKHHLRHNKPFRCDVTGCNRKDGFGTRNDLDRHKKSVHSDPSVAGTRYICRLDQCATRDQPKLWPRADNFRSHLRRIHGKTYAAEDNLEEYIYRDPHSIGSISPDQPALRNDLQGVGGTALSYINTNASMSIQKSVDSLITPSFNGQTMITNSRQDIFADELDSILEDSASFDTKDHSGLSTQDSDGMLMQSSILKGTGQGSLQNGRSFNDDIMSIPSTGLSYTQASQRGLVPDGEILLGHGDDIRSLDHSIGSLESSCEEDGSFDATRSQPRAKESPKQGSEQSDVKMAGPEQEQSSSKPINLSSLKNSASMANDSDSIMEFLKTVPKDMLKSALNGDMDDSKSLSSSQDSASQRNVHACPECKKMFNRQCELKKHLKRHEKPYGCTFEKCTKSFGSKNDWKRHESSQHYQLEIWKCEESKPTHKIPCEKICPRRESFRTHLQREHSMTDPRQVEDRIDRCRIGRHCDPRFWCGFCKEIIQIRGEGVNAWTKRCDHIDNHFCGRDGLVKKNISEWTYLDSEDEASDKSHTDISTQSSSKLSISSPESLSASNVLSSVKRRSSIEVDARSQKRQKHKDTAETHDMWNCCCCSFDMLMSTSSSCCGCEHQRCRNCNITRVNHREEMKMAK